MNSVHSEKKNVRVNIKCYNVSVPRVFIRIRKRGTEYIMSLQ